MLIESAVNASISIPHQEYFAGRSTHQYSHPPILLVHDVANGLYRRQQLLLCESLPNQPLHPNLAALQFLQRRLYTEHPSPSIDIGQPGLRRPQREEIIAVAYIPVP